VHSRRSTYTLHLGQYIYLRGWQTFSCPVLRLTIGWPSAQWAFPNKLSHKEEPLKCPCGVHLILMASFFRCFWFQEVSPTWLVFVEVSGFHSKADGFCKLVSYDPQFSLDHRRSPIRLIVSTCNSHLRVPANSVSTSSGQFLPRELR